jgi:PadR family transcriptional regulator PadR
MTRSRKPSAQEADVLQALSAGPASERYGYDLIRETGLKAGSLYPVLIRLADRGLTESRWEPGQGRPARQLYRLTAARPAETAAESTAPVNDRAQRVLAMAVAWMPNDREEWGRAMLAELGQVSGRRARWRFAGGATRTALIPPRSGRLRVAIVLASLAAAAAIAIYALSPGTGAVTAVAVPGLAALGTWAALARPCRARPVGLAGRAAQVIAIAVIIACLIVALRVLVLYPVHAGGYAWPAGAMVFAAELAACLWPVLRRPGPLGATRHSGLIGVSAALVTAGVLYLNQQPIGPSGSVVLETGIAAPIAAGVLAAALGAARRKPARQLLRAGAGEWLWGVLLTGPAVFIVLTATTTAANAVVIDARHHMLTYIMMTHPHVAPSVLDPIAQRELGDAAVLLSGLLVLVMMIFLVVFPPARARRYLSSLRTQPRRVSRLEPAPAGAGWPDRQPWWPGPVQPGHDAGPDIISHGNPPF